MFYAHIQQNNSEKPGVQTVTAHCRGTAQFAKNVLDKIQLGTAGYLAGLLHDVGKMKQEFQKYLLEGTGNRGSVNHTFAGCRLLLTQFHGETAADYADLTAELLAFAVGAHHGLFDCVNQEGTSGFLYRMQKENIGYEESVENFLCDCADMAELTSLFQIANQELIRVYERLEKLSSTNHDECAFYLGLLARLLLSAVIHGDRLDTGLFFSAVQLPTEPENYSDFWTPYLAHMEKKLSVFRQDTQIQQARSIISQQCCDYGEKPGGIIQLKVPTGGGKTLSSLRYALSHAKKWGKRRILFVSPLLTILEQNAAVIRAYLGDDSIVLEHHSNVIQTKTDAALDLRELAVDTWNHPVIITTLVQFLDTLFDGKTTAIRRFQSLCGSVIVLDEVQTVPERMLSLFNQAVNFLTEICGATVVLCSATQPCWKEAIHPLRPEIRDMIPYHEDIWQPFRRTQILDAGTMTLEETAAFVRATMEQVQSLLVICNKKDEATYLLRALDDAALLCCHLSAAMCPAHRRKRLEQMYQALERGERCFCAATQVMEAGVDISFDCVIRLTAGMDSVVQAAGRCNRNADQKDPAPVYIVTLQDENLSKLKDIRTAKSATASLLTEYRKHPERFAMDLSSDAAIQYYYMKLYGAIASEQDYFLARERVTLYSLLSYNESYWDDTSPFYGKFILNQAFRMAGDAFSVFDNNTRDVVVPYGAGASLIEELASQQQPDLAFLCQWVARAKPYTVSLYEYQLRAMSQVITEYSGILVLAPAHYDEKTGVTMDAGEFDFLEV